MSSPHTPSFRFSLKPKSVPRDMNVTVLLVHVVDRFAFVGESAGVLFQHLRNANACRFKNRQVKV